MLKRFLSVLLIILLLFTNAPTSLAVYQTAKDLAAGKVITYFNPANKDRFTNNAGFNLATDGNSDTYYNTGTLQTDPDNRGGQLVPMIDLGTNAKYNVIKVKHTLSRDKVAPLALRFVYSASGSASSQYKDIVPQAMMNFKDYASVDRYFKIPVRTERYLGYHLNTGTSATSKFIPELKIYDLEAYYDGSLLNGLQLPVSVNIDRNNETRVKCTAINADGQPMTDLSSYEWSFKAINGCTNILGDATTGEIVIPTNASIGVYSVNLTNKENAELSFTSNIDINPSSDEWKLAFNNIQGNENINIPKGGNVTVSYAAYAVDDRLTPNQETITWKLDGIYTGVSISGSTISVTSEAVPSTVRLIATYQGHELYKDINLKFSKYGIDFALGKELKYFNLANTDRFTNRTGHNLATDGRSDTYYTTGTLQIDPDNKGGQIVPMLELDNGVIYNVIRINNTLVKDAVAPLSLRLVLSNNGGASSQYVEAISSSQLNLKDYSELNRYIMMPVKTQKYLGYHFNTGTSSSKFLTELRINDFEVYYDGSLLNSIDIQPDITINRTGETRIKPKAINADGLEMIDLSGYTWKGSAKIGCENVYFDNATGELVVPTNATLGTYNISIKNNDNPELNIEKTINVKVNDSELPTYFNKISGVDSIFVPNMGQVENSYYVKNSNGEVTPYGSFITWSLAADYPGVTISNNSLVVSKDTTAGTIKLLASVGDYQIDYDITLIKASEGLNGILSYVDGPMFVISPYYGEEEFKTSQFTAKAYNLSTVTDGIKWSVKGAPVGVTIDENTGILSVCPKVNDNKIKVIATKEGLSVEKLVTIVSRLEGAPNLLRLPGVTINSYANRNSNYSYDGNFETKSSSDISTSAKSVNITLPKNYNLDVFRAYRDNGSYENSYQTTLRSNGVAFGGKGWSNSPLQADIWRGSPGINSSSLTYSFFPALEAIDIYELELYSTYMTFDRVESASNKLDIPQNGETSIQMEALSESGEKLSTVAYADGEVHPLKWGLIKAPTGISIDENTGVLKVSAQANPTTVTVSATYFGKVRTKAMIIGNVSDSNTLAHMDYDWLTFDKLSSEAIDNVTYKIKLYNKAPNGSNIQWSSSNPQYISINGDVYLPYADSDKSITLTATITNENDVLAKAFNVIIRKPAEFIDKNILSDRELFGLWDKEANMWAVVGKLDYSATSGMQAIGEAVKAMNYEAARNLLYEYTKDKLKNTPYPSGTFTNYNSAIVEAYMNDTISYTNRMVKPIVVGDERAWYSADVTDIAKSFPAFTITLHSEMKEDVLVEVDSRESEFRPYIMLTFKDGKEVKIDTTRDTTIRAGYYVNNKYGRESVLKVLDSGYPIDSNTQRAYMFFDFGSLNIDDIQSARMYLHAENTNKTGNKNISVLYSANTEWDEYNYNWNSTFGSMGFYSYSGTKGGVEFSYPPGGDPESLLNPIGRLTYLHIIGSGFKQTANEKYAYDALDLLDSFNTRAGDNNSYPRGFDGFERNNRIMSMHKNIVDSQYMTPEVTTQFWKHLWELHDHVSIDRDPFFNRVYNMMISMTDQTITFLSEFNEFNDTKKWIDIYIERMLPLLNESILNDGSYIEAADGYAKSSIQTFAASVQKAARVGLSLGDEFNTKILKSLYFYAAMHLPDYNLPVYGQSNVTNITSKEDKFVLSMADLFKDETLKYMGANGKKGGKKPDFTSLLFPETKRVYMRSSWTDDALYLMTNIDDGLKGHGNMDDLSIIAWGYGDFAIPDTGRYTYTAADPMRMKIESSENHNVLGRITDIKNNKQFFQNDKWAINETKLNSWVSNNKFDFFSGNTRESTYSDYYGNQNGASMKTGYNRKIFFVKPNYWIVSDLVEDRAPEGKTDNKYDVMFHFMPGSNYTLDQNTKLAQTNFTDKTNTMLISADKDVELTREEGYFCPISGSYTLTDRIVFSKTKPATEKATFDTIVFPSKSGEQDAKVSADRIQMNVPSSIASAMKINREDSNGKFTDYYYYSNEKSFNDTNTFSIRNFDSFEYDGEVAFVSFDGQGKLSNMSISNGKTLKKDNTEIIKATSAIKDLSINIENSNMALESSVKNFADLGVIELTPGCDITSITYNGELIQFSQVNGVVRIGQIIPSIDTTINNGGEPFIGLPSINYGSYIEYDGKKYPVTVQIPKNTKIRPIITWDGLLSIDIKSMPNDAGTVTIKAGNNTIDFITPISIYVTKHASSTVNLVIDGNKILQEKTLSTNDISKVTLSGKSAGLYRSNGDLWVITNECSQLILGRIGSSQNTENGGTGSGNGNTGGTDSGNKEDPSEARVSKFTDIDNVLWAKEAINELYKKGIIKGKTESTFDPTAEVNRSEFITMLVRAFELKSKGTQASFADVEEGQWYTEAIKTSLSLGIVNGIGNGLFGVEENISRQDMMVMIYRIIELLGIELEEIRDIQNIKDMNDVSDYAKEAIVYMYNTGVISGVGEDRIAPNALAQRAEAAKIIYKIMELSNRLKS